MSDKKRRRIQTAGVKAESSIELLDRVQTPTQEFTETKEETKDDGNDFSEFYDESGEFLWDAYEATCITNQIHILRLNMAIRSIQENLMRKKCTIF